eukprot:TRINITY_DN12446_c0_g1_i6.p1 TRINITY_DN12446_c0_g1~~TRINITY_DN12446_c0_g1_i6.p1  ORF type:complete len:256 (-),score=34.37 TRINITY_DN12446_c0_g1_i6:79-846(-)
MTNFFVNDRALGFTVITSNRPFHLFALDPETRFSFLQAFSLVTQIPSRPAHVGAEPLRQPLRRVNSMATETTAASCIDEISLPEDTKPKRRYCILSMSRPKVRIVPYMNGAMKESFDSVASAEPMSVKQRNASASSTRRHGQLNQSINVPFTVELGKKSGASPCKEEIKIVKLNKQTKERIMKEEVKLEGIKNMKGWEDTRSKEDSNKEERHVHSNSTARQPYRRPRRFSNGATKRKAKLSCTQDCFEYAWCSSL